MVHKNIKSANILLDLELNPHLSDSGLASLINDADQVTLSSLLYALLPSVTVDLMYKHAHKYTCIYRHVLTYYWLRECPSQGDKKYQQITWLKCYLFQEKLCFVL